MLKLTLEWWPRCNFMILKRVSDVFATLSHVFLPSVHLVGKAEEFSAGLFVWWILELLEKEMGRNCTKTKEDIYRISTMSQFRILILTLHKYRGSKKDQNLDSRHKGVMRVYSDGLSWTAASRVNHLSGLSPTAATAFPLIKHSKAQNVCPTPNKELKILK